jgi:[acyl-carrier-protein] S-malonyltransferase
MPQEMLKRLETAAFAFRGYNVTNLGRSDELLAHRVYGPLVEAHLREAGQIASDALKERIDLVHVVRERIESSLDTFGRDAALILAMELAQIQILEQLFEIPYRNAKLAFGYSLGEIAALVCGGVYRLPDVLPPLLEMAREAADLAHDVTMGVLFSRGPELSVEAVERLCTHINMEGRGVVAISSILSPNTVLLLGQGDTVDRFAARMADVLPDKTYLRKNKDRWPPLHTPILWQRLIPNRAARDMHTIPGGTQRPQPPVISLVTGKASYNDFNSRKLINQWIDHPQRLWDAIYETLVAGIETIVHVGPAPNLLPATYKRLSDNIQVQLSGRTLNSLGLRAVSSVWRPWLTKVLSSRTALLQAPFIQHITLEDWLLAQQFETAVVRAEGDAVPG